jgi:hypothetical protein
MLGSVQTDRDDRRMIHQAKIKPPGGRTRITNTAASMASLAPTDAAPMHGASRVIGSQLEEKPTRC